MGSSPKFPTPPTPESVTSAQLGLSTKTGETQQALNMVNQGNPTGYLNYSVVGQNPDGTPIYAAQQGYTPEQQSLFNTLTGTRGEQGASGFNLASSMFPTYSNAPDFSSDANSTVTQGMNNELPYMERFMAPERDQLRTQLINQGLQEGSPAYQQQMDKLTAQQDLTKGNWLNTFQNQAYNQAVQSYTTPEQMITNLMAGGAPPDLKSSFSPTPTVTTQTPDMQAAVNQQQAALQAQFKAQTEKQNNLMSSIFGGAKNIFTAGTGPGSTLGGEFLAGLMA